MQRAKISGVMISKDLKWNKHVYESIRKAYKCLHYLVLPKRAGVSHQDIKHFYCLVITSVLEYRTPIFHHSLPEYLSIDLACVQKRAMSIITPCQLCKNNPSIAMDSLL